MSTQPDDEILDPSALDDDDEVGWKRFQDRLRAAGIRPATEWEDRDDRVVFPRPFSLREFLRRRLRVR